jgi:hydrogenase maturation protease
VTSVLIIGVGNDWRGDDGVGLVVARNAAVVLGSAARLVETDGEPARLIDAWRGSDAAIVVDAVRTGAAPGTVGVWPGDVDVSAVNPRGSHSLGVGEAVALGRQLEALPARLTIVGIEIGTVQHGNELSSEVARALPAAVEAVVRAAQAGSSETSSAGR